MSNSITIGKQVLAGVKGGVKGRVRSYSIYIENLKLVGSVQRSQTQTKMSHSITIGKQILAGVKGRLAPYPSIPGFQQ